MRLAERLEIERHRQFVGRSDELALFQAALTTEAFPFSVLQLHGPGGVGKSTLLHEMSAACRPLGIKTALLDARNFEIREDTLQAAIAHAVGAPAGDSLDYLTQQPQRWAIFIDTAELLAPLEEWLRQVLVPRLPETVVLVLAGRLPLAAAWRSLPGWRNLVRSIDLKNFSRAEAMEYLRHSKVPRLQQNAVLQFTHGHPLALSLVADLFAQQPDMVFRPEEAPDTVQSLLDAVLDHVPSSTHRRAVEACALVRVTTEDLLSQLVGQTDIAELFAWLRSLSFMEASRSGLFPHDLVRESLLADLRWRNREWYLELQRRARNFYSARLQSSSGVEQQRALFDYIFLHRSNPMVQPFLEWNETAHLVPAIATAEELPLLVKMVQRHEGKASAHIAKYWFGRQPLSPLVLRDGTGHVRGFVVMISLNDPQSDDLKTDPAARAAWEYLRKSSPLRQGENCTLFRYWMAVDTYQDVSETQSLLTVNIVRHCLTMPALGFSFLPCADAAFWAPAFAYTNTLRLPECDFEVGGHSYGMYGNDWRQMPPSAWLSLLAERGTDQLAAGTLPPPGTGFVVLSEHDFETAVREGLRSLTRPPELEANSLLRSRLVLGSLPESASSAEKVAMLRQLLVKACESLGDSGPSSKFYRALYHSYLHPAPNQDAAATLADVPFGTFRRHLKTAVQQVAAILWRQEMVMK